MRAWLCTAVVAMTAGCLRSTEFHCTTDTDCGANGVCQSVGFCSFPDATCGQRFGDASGPYAGQCVSANVGSDAGIDAAVDSPAPSGCDGFTAIAGQPHLYKMIATTADWNTQHDGCAGASSSAYLAIPDDATELTALDTFAGAVATYWIGIGDMGQEGVYVTVKGATATFLPWATGEPDNAMNSDCVSAITAAAQFQDDRCMTHESAICECEP
jgi:hypothetical protein